MDYDQVLMLILAQKKSKSIQRIKYSQKYSNIFKSLYQVHINGLVVELWVITSNVSCSDSPGEAYCSLSREKKKKSMKFLYNFQHKLTLLLVY